MDKTEKITNELAILYARVSTQLQVTDGVSLEIQERTLRQAAEAAGYTKTELVKEEGRSGKSISGRPAIRKVLSRFQCQRKIFFLKSKKV